MPNQLTATGLVVSSDSELDAWLTSQFQSIYGTNIVLTSDSPDGQLKNIFKQKILDVQDLLVQVFTSMDPDQAFGTTLDQRVAINGIQRQAGTYTVTPITVVTSQSVNLYGLDQTAQPVYTVADGAGNQWQLQTTRLGVSAGSHSYTFQAAQPGAIPTVPNTITVPVSIVLGVTSVNNPSIYTTLGINEETDAQLRVRRQKSVSLAGQGWMAALLAALQNITGVTSANVFENRDTQTNADGVPGKSIWVVVAGSGAASAIAAAIYSKRSAGCGMWGTQSYVVTQADGSPFPIAWDNVVTRNLFVQFTVSSINGVTSPNIAAIRTGLATLLAPSVNQPVNVNQLATLVQQIDPNSLVSSPGLSTGQTQTLTFAVAPTAGTFTISYNGNTSATIAWNDSLATVTTRVQALSGLAAVVVTGSIAAGLTFDLSAVGGPQALLTAGVASLTAGAPSWSISLQSILTTPTKKNQFVVSSPNLIILPMQLNQSAAAVTHSTGTATFTGVGGYGTLTYSLTTNSSGGSINGATGVYTAGATPNVQDTVTATDQYGNTATAKVLVT